MPARPTFNQDPDMKEIAIGAAALLLIVSGVFYMRDRGARDQLLVARTEITNLSNRVSEIRSNLEAQAQASRGLESNLLSRAQQIASLTTKVDRTSSTLEKTERALATTQQQLSERDQRLTAATTENAQLRQELEQVKSTLAARENDLAQVTAKVAGAEQASQESLDALQKAQVQNTQLLLQLNDPILLRQQMSRLRKQYLSVLYSAPASHPAENGAAGAPEHGAQQIVEKPRPPGGKGRLELQPDGSVRLASPK